MSGRVDRDAAVALNLKHRAGVAGRAARHASINTPVPRDDQPQNERRRSFRYGVISNVRGLNVALRVVLTGQRSNTNKLVRAVQRATTLPKRSPDSTELEEPQALRQKQRRLGKARRRELEEAYRAGQHRMDLATRFSIHPTTVDAILAAARIPLRPRKAMTVDEVNQSIGLYQSQRMSCAQIGTRLGYDGKTIWRALRRRGIPLRDTAGSDRRQDITGA